VSRSDYFRKQAQTCLDHAARARDNESRLAWLDMASQWRRAAGDEEKPVAAVVQQRQQVRPKNPSGY
jgi:hypothetical protein